MKRHNHITKHITEQTIIFASVTKWIIISTLIGSSIGAIVALFLKILTISEESRSLLGFDYYLLLPFALVITVILVRKFAPSAEGHGTEKVIEAVHKKSGYINVMVIPVKLFATVLTIFSGGSVGKEGPAAQIGAGFASYMATLFKFSNKDRKKIVICGISAGFASVFGTPIAGAIFGIEILLVGVLLYDVLLPSIISGFAAFYVAKFLGVSYTYFELAFFSIHDFNLILTFKVILAGVFFGFVADFTITAISNLNKMIKSIQLNYIVKAFLGGVILVILTWIFGESYLGLGFETIENSLSPNDVLYEDVPWYSFILKTIFTSLTLAFGGSGGVITPIFYIGATSGNFFGYLVDGYIPFFAALGFVSVLAGTTNAPIAAMILTVELFGSHVSHYAAICIIIAFLLTGHRSVYPSQVLSMRKSDALNVQIGDTINNAGVTYTTRFFRNILTQIKKLKDRYKKD